VIRRLDGRDPGQPHLFTQPILRGLEEPLHPALGLPVSGLRSTRIPQLTSFGIE
jgi:hypothetical protein